MVQPNEELAAKRHRANQIVYSEGDHGRQIGQLKRYLVRFGYIDPEVCGCGRESYCVHMRRGVNLFQVYVRLPRSGAIDHQTLKFMRQPRCGCRDIPPEVTRAGSLSDAGVDASDPFVFNFNSQPWQTYDLTYSVYNRTSDTVGEVAVVDQAFSVWESVSPLRFTRIAERDDADIEVGWETGVHGDLSPFDGTGGVAAHGFYPETGWLHLDDAESWIDYDATLAAYLSQPFDVSNLLRLLNGTDLLHVAIHEIGHCLGLDHSREDGAIMWPFVQNGKHHLGEEDIRGILSLYPFLAGSNDVASVVHLWAFSGGTGSTVIDLGTRRRALVWGQVTFVDSLNDYDRDNGVALDVFTVDGENPQRVGWGGDHLGSQGAPSNLFQGGAVVTARRVQFRLSTFHSSDLEAYGVGCVVLLD